MSGELLTEEELEAIRSCRREGMAAEEDIDSLFSHIAAQREEIERLKEAAFDAERICLEGQKFTLAKDWFDNWVEKYQRFLDELEAPNADP